MNIHIILGESRKNLDLYGRLTKVNTFQVITTDLLLCEQFPQEGGHSHFF